MAERHTAEHDASKRGCELEQRENFAYLARQSLLRAAVSGWPRRGHSLLELQCGGGEYLESLWHSGFDVTGQEQDSCLRAAAQERRLDVVGGSPALLPFEDGRFDYVVCLHDLENDSVRGEMVAEAFRLAGLGVLLGFSNSFSLHALVNRLVRRQETEPSLAPWKLRALVKQQGKGRRLSWFSALACPARSWLDTSCLKSLNLWTMPFPLGAFCMLRIDFAPSVAGNLLLLPARGVLERAATRAAQRGVCTQDTLS